ncbi:MAG: leucine-rich repeat domain-containing protein [bacterium]
MFRPIPQGAINPYAVCPAWQDSFLGPRCGLVDLEFLTGRSDLTMVSVSNYPPFTDLPAPLMRVSLFAGMANRIRSIAPLANLPNIRSLDISVNLVDDLSPLLTLPKLEFVALGGNPAILEPAGMAVIAGLQARGVQIKGADSESVLDSAVSPSVFHVMPLSVELTTHDMFNLKTRPRVLGIADPALGEAAFDALLLQQLPDTGHRPPPVGEMPALSDRRALDYLYAACLGIKRLDGMDCLSGLRWLYLGNTCGPPDANLVATLAMTDEANCITDLAPLTVLTHLEELDLSGNRVTDLTPLLALRHLQRVVLTGNPLSKKAIAEQIPMLTGRGVQVINELRDEAE